MVISFEAISRIKINLEKSELIPIGSVDNVVELTFELGCKGGELLTTYLSLPLGASYKLVVTCDDGVEENFFFDQKRKSNFLKVVDVKKTIYLKREEATLIRRTSSNLHIYFKLLFIILRKIELRLEKSLKRFPLGRWDSRRNHTKLNG